MNRGAEFGLKIALDYIFYRDSRVTTWFKKVLEEVDVKEESVVKYKHLEIE